jgi:hypothetical protein
MANQVDASIIRQHIVEAPDNTGAVRASIVRQHIVEGADNTGAVRASIIRQHIVEGPAVIIPAQRRRPLQPK